MKRYAKSGGREISFLAAVEVVVVKEAGEVVIEVDLAQRRWSNSWLRIGERWRPPRQSYTAVAMEQRAAGTVLERAERWRLG